MSKTVFTKVDYDLNSLVKLKINVTRFYFSFDFWEGLVCVIMDVFPSISSVEFIIFKLGKSFFIASLLKEDEVGFVLVDSFDSIFVVF